MLSHSGLFVASLAEMDHRIKIIPKNQSRRLETHMLFYALKEIFVFRTKAAQKAAQKDSD